MYHMNHLFGRSTDIGPKVRHKGLIRKISTEHDLYTGPWQEQPEVLRETREMANERIIRRPPRSSACGYLRLLACSEEILSVIKSVNIGNGAIGRYGSLHVIGHNAC